MKKIYPVVANIVKSTANFGGVKSASLWAFYQPRTPKIK